MTACERSEQPARALEVFEQMQARGIRPNAHTYVHRHETQRQRQYKKYKKQIVYRPLLGMRAVAVRAYVPPESDTSSDHDPPLPSRLAWMEGGDGGGGGGGISAAITSATSSGSILGRTAGSLRPSFLLPPGRDIPTGFSYIVPDRDGRTPEDGRTAPPPSLLAMQEKI
jgi:pentatricopeptide repeat protein